MDISVAQIALEFAIRFLPWLISTAFVCGALYTAIRKDLLRAVEKAEGAAVTANKAHERIDDIQNILLTTNIKR